MKRRAEQIEAELLRNMETHRCAVAEEDYERIAPKIDLLQRLAEAERSLFAVFDMNKKNYLLESPEQKRLFGSNNIDREGKYNSDSTYRNIHPDDFAFVLETDLLIYRFYSQLQPAEKMNYKLIYDFRVKDTDGFYRRYMHQSIIMELDKNGKAWLSLVITDLLPEKAGNYQPQRRLINIKNGKLYLFTDDENNSPGLLTKREKEILHLISRGYDSKSISDKLFISVNTVNNHRQNILRKTRTENTTQAVLYCKRLGII
ncbi:helix-turn-helix domain-containing protein [Maribellus maritimus]|uniref:helix-turn-helix domain-containing protein n=1 Tax=Maribellus maritimus TaxID=2870838 RepID=UPI001EEC24F4|nr:LuxR C-terminal-related transcriptional regulator [Maribellus maritimus]MCG6189391.1 LuxR C-terminal-related transcriptional regulator [Maribellus maritimus]